MRTVTEASAPIKTLLAFRGPGIYSLISHPEVALIEIPNGNLSQFGGLVKIQKNTQGQVRVIGAAGSAVGQFNGMNCLRIKYNAHKMGRPNGPYQESTYGRRFCYHSYEPQSIDFVDAPSGDLSTQNGAVLPGVNESNFTAVNIVEELELGWICVCETGLIWQGRWAVESTYQQGLQGTVNTSYLMGVSDLTIAVATRSPLYVKKASINWPLEKATYMASVTSDVRSYVNQAWDENYVAMPALIKVSQPVVVLSSSQGVEIGSPFRQATGQWWKEDSWNATIVGFFSAFLRPVKGGTSFMETGHPLIGVNDITCAVLPAVGSKISGIICPRLNGYTGSDYIADVAKRIGNVDELAAVRDWPATFGTLNAANILGPCFPSVYAADHWVATSGGDVAASVLFQPRGAIPFLAPDQMDVRPADAALEFKGDAAGTDLGHVSKSWTSSISFGGSIEAFFGAWNDAVSRRAEDLLRANQSSFL